MKMNYKDCTLGIVERVITIQFKDISDEGPGPDRQV